MIIKNKHERLESLPRQDFTPQLKLFTQSLQIQPCLLLCFHWRVFMILKTKIPATSTRQKPFSKLSQVTHIRWLS
jgi:hypothetical protein